MPYYQRQAELDRSLAAYRSVYAGTALEFSICDDGSPDPVIAPGCRVVALPKKTYALNPCVPINAAVRHSTHDIIVLTNPEVVHSEPVLDKMREALRDEDDYVTTGCRDSGSNEWLAGPRTKYGSRGREPVPPGGHFHFCAMFHRSLFARLGGFDEQFRHGQGCDDNDWLWKLYATGANFKYVPGVVWHYRTPHKWTGTTAQNAKILRSKWRHLWPK